MCLLFNFLMIKFTVISKKAISPLQQIGKIGVLVNFITPKLKSRHLPLSVFSGQRFFWGNEGKYFPHIPCLYLLLSFIAWPFLKLFKGVLRVPGNSYYIVIFEKCNRLHDAKKQCSTWNWVNHLHCKQNQWKLEHSEKL